MLDAPLFQIKLGSTRCVILIGSYAFKFPRAYSWTTFLYGLLANAQEALFSGLSDSVLCPVLFSVPGGWLTVMPRCIPLTDSEFEDPLTQSTIRRSVLRMNCIEGKRDSFGWYCGQIVACDYGTTYSICTFD